MYIQKIDIDHIRSIDQFEMTFDRYPGWHVLIGDNGAGKSTIIRSVALAMLEPGDVYAARQDWNDWLQTGQPRGSINVLTIPDSRYEATEQATVQNKIRFENDAPRANGTKQPGTTAQAYLSEIVFRGETTILKKVIAVSSGAYYPPGMSPPVWFSAAYGPFRRFTGGNAETEKLFTTNPRLGAHLSAFGEDVALTEALTFIKTLYEQQLEDQAQDQAVDHTFDDLKAFINQSGLLPHGATLAGVSTRYGLRFRDANGIEVNAIQMSDGYRSVLSLTLELIRQLIRSYGSGPVFANVRTGGKTIDLPGVVLIDEIDAHLHPTWQTRIGNWFLDYFPSLQFIVTTHSPLICRACERGSIWRLAAPGTDDDAGQVTGQARDRLIYGNVLDAYGTEVFGQDVTQSEAGQQQTEELVRLNKKSIKGTITDPERQRLYSLRAKLPTVG